MTGIRSDVADTTGVTFGIQGISNSAGDGSAGVVGQSTATSGNTAGLYGQVASSDGVAGVFENTAGGQIIRALNNGTEVFRVLSAGDIVIGGLSPTDSDSIFFDATPGENLTWSGPQGRFKISDTLVVVDNLIAGTTAMVGYNAFGSASPFSGQITSAADVLVGDDLEVTNNIYAGGSLSLSVPAQSLSYSLSNNRFEFSTSIRTAGSLVVGASGTASYSAFGATSADSSGVDTWFDVFVADDLEVDGTIFADGSIYYGCGTYLALPPGECPVGSIDGPDCRRVGVGALCEGDGECGTAEGANTCGSNEWYLRTE